MTWLNALHWQQPLWLLLALLPWLLRAYQHRQTGSARLAKFADAHLLPRLVIGRPAPAHTLLFVVAWTLAAIAAAGPYWSKHVTPAETRGADIAVVIDISPSMAVADLAPDRLTRVKHELRDFVRLLGGDRLGLVVFSGNAYPALPLTADRDAFLQFVDLLDPSLTSRPGSNLTRAIDAAVRMTEHSAPGSRAVLLISDGEFHDVDAASAVAALRAQDIPLLTLGAATDRGGPVLDGQGHFLRHQNEVVISRIDRARLQQLARDTGGRYAELREDDGEWRVLIDGLRARTQETTRPSAANNADAVPFYPWLLAASLALFLWAGARRREALAMLVLPVLLFTPPSADAAPWTEQRAYDALQAHDYRQAQQLYAGVKSFSGALGAGTAAYRLQDWNAALSHFEHATRSAANDQDKARALYNAGNALARLARYDDASKRYQAALRLDPNFSKAALNLNLVNEFLDARRGLQQTEDSEPSLASSDTRPDAKDSAAIGRGDDATLSSSSPPTAQPNARQEQQRSGAPQTANTLQKSTAADLQQVMTLWRDAQGQGSGGAVELEALRDNTADFLRWRFREEDFGSHVKKKEDKPW